MTGSGVPDVAGPSSNTIRSRRGRRDGRAARAISTGERHDRSTQWADWTFAAVIAVAVPVILYQGRDQWFFLDEWDFLADRSAGSFHDLMAPHAQHWTTFGVLVYRALWQLVGLRHYWPYQLCLVTLHLATAVLLRVVMRRARRQSVDRDSRGVVVRVLRRRTAGHRLRIPDRLHRAPWHSGWPTSCSPTTTDRSIAVT